ncbi:MAG: glycosyltransferase [Bacteroidales bacterium]|jgi:glycosyltransferase involved in cell wall biosynthesis|nr:glycosyltransferase [Bacteroidales bacterium]
MMQPKVSIIVPIYNVEKYLNCCVDSLLNQTLTELEIILVDDGSPDHCPEICDEYAKQDHRVKVVHKKNGGQGYARNSGIETATGEYIAFVDSDDYVDADTYQKLYSIATDTKADGVYFTYQRFNDRGDTWGGTTIRKKTLYHTEEDIRRLMLDMIASPPETKSDRDIECSSCCALYRTDIIKRHGLGFKSERELHSEDLLFNLDFLTHAASIAFIPDALYHYRENPSSFCHTIRADVVERERFYYQYLKDWLSANKFGLDGYLRATRHFIGDSRSSIRQYIQSPLPGKEKKQWLKETVNHSCWKEIASSYPYRQLPLKYALYFYLLHKGCHRLLYHLSATGRVRY